MKVTVQVTRSFTSDLKALLKKYPSLSKDLLLLEKELRQNPKQGTALGHNAFKIRLKISSKGKGKSGGARVISIVEAFLVGQFQLVEEEITVSLITIYDKSDVSNITDKELKDLIKSFYNEK